MRKKPLKCSTETNEKNIILIKSKNFKKSKNVVKNFYLGEGYTSAIVQIAMIAFFLLSGTLFATI